LLTFVCNTPAWQVEFAGCNLWKVITFLTKE
jgi:hypothetical protein